MGIDIEVESFGWDTVIDGLANFDLQINGEFTVEELTWIGNRILEIARESISTLWPPASLPFEAPHLRTGDLRESLQMFVDEANLRVVVGTDIGYGKFLELSTSRMQARPFLIPALFQALEEFKQRFKERGGQLLRELLGK